jgi:hypothetical protein
VYKTSIDGKILLTIDAPSDLPAYQKKEAFVPTETAVLANGEFYIAPSYNYLIKEGKKIGVYHIPNEQHWAVGTESDLEIYLRNNNE